MIFSKKQKVQPYDDDELDIDEAYKLGRKREDPAKMRCSLKLLILMIALFIMGVFIKLNDYKGDQIQEVQSFTTCPEGKYANRNQCQFCNYKCLKCTDVYGLCIQCEKGYHSDYNGVCKKKTEQQIIIKEYNQIPFLLNVGLQQDYFFFILQDNIFDSRQYNLNYTFVIVDTYNLMSQKGYIIDEKFINKTISITDEIKKQNFTQKILLSYGCKQQQAFSILQTQNIFDQLFLINPNNQECEQYISNDLINYNYQSFSNKKILAKDIKQKLTFLYQNLSQCESNQKRLLTEQMDGFKIQQRNLQQNESEIKVNGTDQKEENKTNRTNNNQTNNDTKSDKPTQLNDTQNTEKQNNTVEDQKNTSIESKGEEKDDTQDNSEESEEKEQKSEEKEQKSEEKEQKSEEKEQKEESQQTDQSEEDSEQLTSVSESESEEIQEKDIKNYDCYQLNENSLLGQTLLDQISQIINNQVKN